ncbi:H2A super family protein [Kluyveromyces marxianus DMKU3-1042]|uniref:H2A super family protein n=2 Tax=Kluyveromyces marxianus TaxID=4911 RepID=W0TDR8_KLUMD|nr:H2A super family protein [Kluyveromyces marxianus DMKU3-1042]BAO41490.1 H2A super family protein [Kluyveromyces marxianus DMKU3-1042]
MELGQARAGEAIVKGLESSPGQRQEDLAMSEYETGGSSDERASSLTPGGAVTEAASAAAATAPPVVEAASSSAQVFSKIKTHFPPAKIKKIMQTDEDIGKVSQATPVITGRSLEFFIALLVDKSSKVARDQGSKRISADIMKKTILTDEKFDFLREVILPQEQEQEQAP